MHNELTQLPWDYMPSVFRHPAQLESSFLLRGWHRHMLAVLRPSSSLLRHRLFRLLIYKLLQFLCLLSLLLLVCRLFQAVLRVCLFLVVCNGVDGEESCRSCDCLILCPPV